MQAEVLQQEHCSGHLVSADISGKSLTLRVAYLKELPSVRKVKTIDVFVANRKENQGVEEKHKRNVLLDLVMQDSSLPFLFLLDQEFLCDCK
jgi:hypothetical protein